VQLGTILHVIWNQEQDGDQKTESLDTSAAIQVAVEAMKTLIRENQKG
jgi:hypothetical protein